MAKKLLNIAYNGQVQAHENKVLGLRLHGVSFSCLERPYGVII